MTLRNDEFDKLMQAAMKDANPGIAKGMSDAQKRELYVALVMFALTTLSKSLLMLGLRRSIRLATGHQLSKKQTWYLMAAAYTLYRHTTGVRAEDTADYKNTKEQAEKIVDAVMASRG